MNSCHLKWIMMLLFASGLSLAQPKEGPIRTFGYFQNSFEVERTDIAARTRTGFALQQLNVFFQKDLARNWTALVNFEYVNSFSDNRGFGAASLEEAWVRWRANKYFSLKLGLQIPEFNNLNQIKNKTPLLPYIIRPIVYEATLAEAIPSLAREEWLPAQAFVQAYGFKPLGRAKLDWAAYLGNSPNVTREDFITFQQTGVDTSATLLVGGRLGVRYKELKLGVSAASDFWDLLTGATGELNGRTIEFEQFARFRLGQDFQIRWNNFLLEWESIQVFYDTKLPDLSLDKQFFYGLLGYEFKEKLFVYAAHYNLHEDGFGFAPELFGDMVIPQIDLDVDVNLLGFSYALSERLRLKGQILEGNIGSNEPGIVYTDRFHIGSAAISVIF